jgi:hypothetical protein
MGMLGIHRQELTRGFQRGMSRLDSDLGRG